MPVFVKLSWLHRFDGSYDLYDAAQLIRFLEELGFDAIDATYLALGLE
jgi:hypothetical protein